MNYYSPDDSHLTLRALRFVRRMFIMRQLGTFLCFIPILSVLLAIKSHQDFCILLGVNAFVWPVVAYRLARAAPDPIGRERRHLTLDAAFGGVWVALMGLSPVPSLIIMAILAADRYSAGGWPQLKPALAAFFAAFLLVWTAAGMPLHLTFSTLTVWLTLPLATCYILALSAVSYHLTLSLRSKNRELERIALMDPGLQIPNRRLFERRLESELLRTRRGESAAYLMILDVDHFKQVNDTFGHETGDFLLAEISALLRKEVGLEDIPARFGGDELGVIVRNADDTRILMLAERLREKIARIRLPASATFHCSVSIGIAPAGDAASIHEWLRNADHALYHVKRSGRNGVFLAEGIPVNITETASLVK
ncbi:diguanylate cyclase AdrA [Chimaeribacter arupi]|uniref:diguanylate cyclase n=1 Tax=Chimaeribacter arupi TaxID=2060066 RepID=UPI000C7DE913|nr:diguanylate cyclase [Chimaeribacter arupi]MDV5139033.1 diguanylate cyclase [Chimaeribacter arupi]PLR31978.1 diguanylate cyclase AdrA [Chimaeribacter arupi]PLR45317.1 diguanylate cyclase AdrA [Chimaeribacter arupi]PLR45992.1 diguanylate cyclase AdrA [Chimaeribacter arupi]